MTIPIFNIIFILLLVCVSTTTTKVTSTSESKDEPPPRGPLRTSYVFMTVHNKRTGARAQSCVNYQQYLREDISSKMISYDFESAKSFTFKYWEGVANRTKICPVPSKMGLQINYGGDIIPLDYRIEDDGSSCTKKFSKTQTGFRNASQFMVDVLKEHNASASLLILDRGHQFVESWNDYLFSDFYDPYISNDAVPTFYIYRTDLDNTIMAVTTEKNKYDDIFDDQIEIRFHRPSGGLFDYSFVVIWLISMICVSGGGLWAFHRHRAGKDVATQRVDDDASANEADDKGLFERCAGVITIGLMMLTLCAVLFLGYFFRPVLVYIFNIFLVIFGTCSLYGCIRGFFSNFSFTKQRWYIAQMEWLPTCCGRAKKYQYSEAFITLICFSFCATWFVVRRQPYAFILLDIINMALCLHVLKCLRLPSLKWISLLMLCMFLYDAFMVFGTPYITSNGCSVMLEVATGLSCAPKIKTKGYPIPPIQQQDVPEKFPMLMQVAHFNPMNTCMDMEVELGFQFTILGLGDIVMPGYLVAHCFTMNGFTQGARQAYGGISILGYGIGLVITFVALGLMKTAQPALIYLVPSTLLPIIVMAICRGEFRKIWDGVPVDGEPLVGDRAEIQGKKWLNNASSPDNTMQDIVLNIPNDQPATTGQQNPPVNV